MWQFQWMLSLIPDGLLIWIYYLLLGTGTVFLSAGWLMKWVPFFNAYKTLSQLIGVILIAGSLYLLGGYGVEMSWRAKVADLESKLEEAKKESAKVNTVVETKVVTKTKIIKEKADTIVQYVDRVKEITKFDETCPIPKEAIDVHNEAARMNKAIEELRNGAKK
jgi:hypothetical protein